MSFGFVYQDRMYMYICIYQIKFGEAWSTGIGMLKLIKQIDLYLSYETNQTVRIYKS